MIKTDIKVKLQYNRDDLINEIINRLPVNKDEIKEVTILKRRLDIDNGSAGYKMTLGISFDKEREAGLLRMKKKVGEYIPFVYEPVLSKLTTRPVVVGAGPSGLFCALVLAEGGAKPIILERGLDVERRIERVNRFIKERKLDTECNIQFGEGGAGTYSDGKLKVGCRDEYKFKVLSEFITHGAGADIMYSDTAHIGTDRLSLIIKSMREKIISLGGEFIFSAKLTDIMIKDGKVCGAEYIKDGENMSVSTNNLVLAVGHSARDTFRMLLNKGIPMQQKGFGVGLRIEHPREYINKLIYGGSYTDGLESASYHLVTHLQNGRSVYSFCMCPGGTVVAAASDTGGVVTNGMSVYNRDGDNSNAAILVSVTPEDFGGGGVLGGFEFQRKLEALAYRHGGENYSAPMQNLRSFMSGGKPSSDGVRPTYPLGCECVSHSEYLPEYITQSIALGIRDFEDWKRGYFLDEAVLTGVETRSTSPVRILRTLTYEAEGVCGLYPIGEGAGYAGGIVSSATDGVRCARTILMYKNN